MTRLVRGPGLSTRWWLAVPRMAAVCVVMFAVQLVGLRVGYSLDAWPISVMKAVIFALVLPFLGMAVLIFRHPSGAGLTVYPDGLKFCREGCEHHGFAPLARGGLDPSRGDHHRW